MDAATARWVDLLGCAADEAATALGLPPPAAALVSHPTEPALGIAWMRGPEESRIVLGRTTALLDTIFSSPAATIANAPSMDLLLQTEVDLENDSNAPQTAESGRWGVHGSVGAGRGAAMIFDAAPAPNRPALGVEFESVAGRLAALADAAAEGYMAQLRIEISRRIRETLLPALVATDRTTLFQTVQKSLRFDLGFNRLMVGILHPAGSNYRIEHAVGFDSSQHPVALPANGEDGTADELSRLIQSGAMKIFDPQPSNPAVLLPLADGAPVLGAVLMPLHLGRRSIGFAYADGFRFHALRLLVEPLEALQRLATAALVAYQQKHEAEELAHHDALTGLYNRRYLDRVLSIEASRMKRYSRPLSLMMVDLCDFKRINDQHGHVYGDLILRETAQLLRSTVREPDIVVRFGGDEFVILMPNTQGEQALIARRRIERAVEERNRSHADPSTFIELSVGLQTADGTNIHRLIEDADRQMYGQKTERTKRRILEVLLGLPNNSADLLDNVITSLLTSLKKREPFYAGHSQRVAFLCLVMAREMHLPPMEIRSILLAALLHDVGKVSLPGEILRRPGPLEPAEREAIHAHPVIGEEFFRGLQYMEGARPIIRHHHERWDGLREGSFPAYPDGLRGEDIPLGARILKLADSMDAMLSERPYKSAQSAEEVHAEIRRERGHSFDPRLVDLMANDALWKNLDSVDELHALYNEVLGPSDKGREAVSG